MAIDTTSKRASATFLLLPFYTGVITDGIVDIDETIAASWMYNGIIPFSPPILSPISETIITFTVFLDRARDLNSLLSQIQQNDIGIHLIGIIKDGDSIVDISSATTKNVILGKPHGTSLVKSGVFVTDGTDGKLKYTTISGDLDETGFWKMQLHVINSDGEWRSDIGNFEVHKNI